MLTFIIFLAVISILVFVHELGHFLLAKKAGMKVEEFGFGFPPRLSGFKKDETVYSINWIPFGGFVKIFGEDGGHRNESGSFGSKSFWARMKVILAGVVMNILFAAVLLTAGNFLGLRVGLISHSDVVQAQDKRVQILEVFKDSPADKAGLKPLDEIIGFKLFDGSFLRVSNESEVKNFTASHRGQVLTIVIKRGSQTVEKEVEARLNPPENQGALGIGLALTGIIKHPWYESIWRGVYATSILTINTVLGYAALFTTLFTKGKLIADVSGPIGIANLTGQAARVGFNYLLQFVAMISVNLAVLNAIPFPALDGGRALVLIIEKLRGAPINRKVEGLVNAIGFSILIILMIVITAKDISRFL